MKHGPFAHLNKCQFYQDEICFLSYIVSTQKIQIKNKKIEIVKF